MAITIMKLVELHENGLDLRMSGDDVHERLADPNITDEQRKIILKSIEDVYKLNPASGEYEYCG